MNTFFYNKSWYKINKKQKNFFEDLAISKNYTYISAVFLQ